MYIVAYRLVTFLINTNFAAVSADPGELLCILYLMPWFSLLLTPEPLTEDTGRDEEMWKPSRPAGSIACVAYQGV